MVGGWVVVLKPIIVFSLTSSWTINIIVLNNFKLYKSSILRVTWNQLQNKVYFANFIYSEVNYWLYISTSYFSNILVQKMSNENFKIKQKSKIYLRSQTYKIPGKIYRDIWCEECNRVFCNRYEIYQYLQFFGAPAWDRQKLETCVKVTQTSTEIMEIICYCAYPYDWGWNFHLWGLQMPPWQHRKGRILWHSCQGRHCEDPPWFSTGWWTETI